MYLSATNQKQKVETACPFTKEDVLRAFNEEVHMFLHVHMRGYDRTGEGLHMDATYYDKYGAPVSKEESWMEGYHTIELELARHFNECVNPLNDFPLIAGMAGGAHLYRPVGHDVEPWNWTGWVPRKKLWCSYNEFHINRHFINIRGNEIQNNLWDYHPFQEQNDKDDDLYEQITPVDKFQGGYWLYDQPWGRYIHLIAIKSHETTLGINYRYNWIVHPLAYRGSVHDLPDNTVDGTQWSVLNIKYDGHFNDPTKWGTDVHGIELFNDFTYYFSWVAKHPGINIHNGELMNYNVNDASPKKKYVYWFDTYPLEFGEFLLETSLERGVYLQALSANDAYYNRDVVPPYSYDLDEEGQKLLEAGERRLLSDPKGVMLKKTIISPVQQPEDYLMKVRELDKLAEHNPGIQKSLDFLKTRPYNIYTAFGHTTLVDTNLQMRGMMTQSSLSSNLETAETTALSWLINGNFFAHTGAYDIFFYEEKFYQSIPFSIRNQTKKERMCYRMTEEMELVFTFPPVKFISENLVWRYTIQYIKPEDLLGDTNEYETVQGYFKMSTKYHTRLNLMESYNKEKVKWIQFSAFRPDNPQRRAWFNPIRGLAFGQAEPNVDRTNGRTHIIKTLKDSQVQEISDGFGSTRELREYREDNQALETFACKREGNKETTLEFLFPQCSPEQEEHIYVYNMQVAGLQPELNKNTENTRRNPDGTFYLPPRILQNINGYFRLNQLYPVKLKLAYQWDPATVKDNTVCFYCVDTKTGQARQIEESIRPVADMPEGYEA